MKKKFISNLKDKKCLPLSIYLLEADGYSSKNFKENMIKCEKAEKINAKGYELLSFYKVISKF
ncbi:hypothetical protein N824_24930 [Pedobacter sp. V48]|nr:hypothetical protein N824_24930 [Pedobacter sp. V48]